MEITEKDLTVIFENGNLREEDKSILIEFCNSFQQRFSDFVNRNEFLNRISRLKEFNYNHRGEKAEATYSQDGILTINDDVHESKRKAIIYHELMHLISMHIPRENPEIGPVQGFRMESEDINEIMTEYYSTRLLLDEGIDELKGKNYITNSDGIEEYVEHDGTGYVKEAKLGEVYHNIFGEQIEDAYFNNATQFQKMFDEKYTFLQKGEWLPFEMAVTLNGNIYKNYANALRIFMTNVNEKFNSGNLSIYDYLKESKVIRDCLPVRKDRKLEECKNSGIPKDIEKFLRRLDGKFVAKFLRPDLAGNSQDDKILKKRDEFFIALNAIRDNIHSLTPEDLENIDMNFIFDNDKNKMIISVNGKNIEAYTDGETYLGTNEIEGKNKIDLLESAIEETEQKTRTEVINKQVQQIRNSQNEKEQIHNIQK